MARAPAILGIVGGVLGLLMSGLGLLLSAVVLALTFGGATFLFFPMFLDAVGAVFGIVGGAVALSKPRPAGWVLLAGVGVGLAGWLAIANEALSKGLSATNLFVLILVFFLWWAIIMLIGGLLAITRKSPTPPSSQPKTAIQ